MTGTVIDARAQFLSKALIDRLEMLIKKDDNYHCYCLHIEEDGEDFLELRLRDISAKADIVIDRAPMLVYHERKENGQPLFEIYSRTPRTMAENA